LQNTILRFGLYDKEKLVGICLVVKIKARRGHYFHFRHGPVLLNFEEQFPHFLQLFKEKTKQYPVDFYRMSPLLSVDNFDTSFFKKLKFRNAPIHNMDAENTCVLDVQRDDEVLLAGMRKTTRYLIRKAQKMPIEIIQTTDMKDFSTFNKLYEITSKRHGFVPHRGMKEELEIFSKDDQAVLFLAKYERKIIAGAIIIFYGNQAIYHHAASDETFRDIPAPYLLQWEVIKEAKKRGKQFYNFWGVVPENKQKHPWQGLSLFKLGFGGVRENSIHAQDLPLKITYWKTYAIETAWRIKRGY
jgi:lipid II:glycine glycyltransferase (peptidoglycan interpeptide bridge formation enzyme)